MEIKKTKDYKKFKFIKGNREVNARHIGTIKGKMKQLNLTELSPIIVNSKFEIIDGQHRFEACKELEYPIYYVVGNGLTLEAVHTINSKTSNWTGWDFLNMYCAQGNKNYIKLRNFIEEWKINLWDAINLLSFAGYNKKVGGNSSFYNGDFIVNKDAARLAEEIAGCLFDFSKKCEYFRTRAFVIAFSRIYMLSQYDHNRMKKQLALYKNRLERCYSWREWARVLDEVYNYKNKDKVGIRFMIAEKTPQTPRARK